MKKLAIFKIVLFSIVIVILIVLLIYGITNKSNFGFFGFTRFYYSNEKEYIIAKDNVEINANDIDKLEVHWIGGTITIDKSDNDQIQFYEICSDEIKENEDNLMRYLVKNNKLTIQFGKSKTFFRNKVKNGKELVIKVPSELLSEIKIDCISADISYQDVGLVNSGSLKIDTTSGNIDIKNTNLNVLKINSVSGYIKVNNLLCNNKILIDLVSGNANLTNIETTNLEIEAVSGDINVSGIISSLIVETVSGSIKAALENTPMHVDCETVSGKSTISLPDNSGFEVSLDSVSGKISTNFEVAISNKKFIYKNGGLNYKFKSVSGDVRIEIVKNNAE